MGISKSTHGQLSSSYLLPLLRVVLPSSLPQLIVTPLFQVLRLKEHHLFLQMSLTTSHPPDPAFASSSQWKSDHVRFCSNLAISQLAQSTTQGSYNGQQFAPLYPFTLSVSSSLTAFQPQWPCWSCPTSGFLPESSSPKHCVSLHFKSWLKCLLNEDFPRHCILSCQPLRQLPDPSLAFLFPHNTFNCLYHYIPYFLSPPNSKLREDKDSSLLCSLLYSHA